MKPKLEACRNLALSLLLLSLLFVSPNPIHFVAGQSLPAARPSFDTYSTPASFSPVLNAGGTIRKTSVGRYDAASFGLSNGRSLDPRYAAVNTWDQGRPSSGCNDGWYDGAPVNGVSGEVRAVAVDGAGNLYVGGYFAVAGSVMANNVAKWDGTSWSALGSGTNGGVLGIAVSGTDVYIGGIFTTAGGLPANYVAKWNGSIWSPVGQGPEHQVYDLKMSGTNIYVGGASWDAGAQSYEWAVSVWNGSNWSTIGPTLGYTVSSIELLGNEIYAGGGIYSVGGVPANQIVKWNGSVWSNVGSGFNGQLLDLALSGGNLYAAGSRPVGNGVNIGVVAQWNGSGWTDLGSGMTNAGTGSYAYAYSIAVHGSNVYASGYFSTAGGVAANGVAKWNGSGWSAVGSWGGSFISTVAVAGTDVYFGGSFSSPGGVRRADGIAKWNGSSWSAFGSGIYNVPNALVVSGSDVYGAGYFTTDGGNTVSRAAKWNGSGWTHIGVWPSGPGESIPYIQAVAVMGKAIFVGGRLYDPATDTNRGFVLRWNASTWSELGSGMTGTGPFAFGDVQSLAVLGSDVYAAGYFASAGGTPANNIARWNGTSWSPVNAGTNWGVHSLAVSGTDLYAGGEFTTAGGAPANKFAKWDGNAWTAIGDGPMEFALFRAPESGYHRVTSIAASGSDLYAGGMWDMSDYEDTGFVSKWNGSDWSEVLRTTSCCASVNAIALSGSELYAAGGIPGGVARWSESNWATTGFGNSDVSWGVTGLAVSGGEVFVGGSFWTAGCHVSAGFARYSPVAAAEVSVSGRVASTGGRGIGNARVTLSDPYGGSRVTITSAFGYFRFEDVTVGQSYAVDVRSKRYSFQPRTVQVNAELTSVNFVPLE